MSIFNIDHLLNDFVKSIRLQEKITRLRTPNHGSSTGEQIEIIQYKNPLTHEWDNQQDALLGACISMLRPHIKNLVEKELQRQEYLKKQRP